MTDGGRPDADAATLIRRAANDLADGRLEDAEAGLRIALKAAPDHPDALHVLGLVYARTDRNTESIDCLARAAARDPNNASYHHNLGLSLATAERWPEAEAAFRRVAALGGLNFDTRLALGGVLIKQDKPGEAEIFLRAAVDEQPQSYTAHTQLAMALEEQGKIAEAESHYRRALTFDEAPTLYFNLGNVLKDQHRVDEALAAYDRAIEMRPRFAEAHVHAAFALLLKGDYPLAWREYEWRWAVPAFAGFAREFPRPVWDGGPLHGRTLLLHAEQGFGDTLQFARYAGVAARMGARVVLECQPALVRLMRSAAGVDAVVAFGEPLPPFDFHAPLLSAPRLLGTTLKTVPRNVPYLAAEPALVGKWRKRLAGRPGLKVGIAWRGTAERRGNPARACPLAAFAPLIDNPRLRLFSLQKELPAEDRPLPEAITDLGPELADFADTAAAIAALDVVVSIDTAVAHLAGALGQPTLLMLSTAGDWRWLTKRTTSPWYPSIRVFRQGRPGDWPGVLKKVARALAARTAGRGGKKAARPGGKKAAPRRRRRRAGRT